MGVFSMLKVTSVFPSCAANHNDLNKELRVSVLTVRLDLTLDGQVSVLENRITTSGG